VVSNFRDDFNRDDGDLGSNWTIPCGQAGIFDEAVLPLNAFGSGGFASGAPVSPVDLLTDQKTQVFYTAQSLDSPHQVVRGIWGHDDVTPADVNGDPRFTIFARATKDPLLLDLGGSEQPLCYDQAYGLRVTCALSGGSLTLSLIKLTPDRRINSGSTSTSEPDDASVLASVAIPAKALNLDPAYAGTADQTTSLPYKGFWQDMRLRVSGTDGRVLLEAFLNDRYEQTPILSFEDHQDPLWSAVGDSGFEFISPVKDDQPPGASGFEQAAKAVMRCTLFEVGTTKVFEKPRSQQPFNQMTYGRVIDRVITLVEQNGEAQYSSTVAGQTKRDTYLQFILEAESHIIRQEGYYDWLQRESRIYLSDGEDIYELPEDHGLTMLLRPGNWQGPPFNKLTNFDFQNRLGNITSTSGKPTIWTETENSINNRERIKVFPIPAVSSLSTSDSEDPYMVIEYYARQLRPYDPDVQLPLVPQHNIDVLIYGAAAHALMLDTDPQNAQRFAAVFQGKMNDLRRENNRKVNDRRTVMRSAADTFQPNVTSRIPLLRATQLETLLI
jgi:hypothetical protein